MRLVFLHRIDDNGNSLGVDSIAFGFINVMNPGSNQQTSRFSQIINHPEYDPAQQFLNDITLLRLATPVTFDNYVRPLCLATLVEETAMYRDCQAAGWGALDYDTGGTACML